MGYDNNLDKVQESYNMLSNKYFTHASPTLFNAGTLREQNASCYLLNMEDSIKGIYKCLSDSALISKYAGGIGIGISDIRAKDSIIRGTNGKTSGIIPMLRVFNDTAFIAYTLIENKVIEGKFNLKNVFETRIYHKENGTWKMVHFHRN